MKRILGIAAILSMIAFSASAEATSWKLKFESAGAPAAIYTFKKDGTSVDDKGVAGTYSYDDAAKKLCDTSGKAGCVTFGATIKAAGESTNYTTGDGKTGTVTVVAAE